MSEHTIHEHSISELIANLNFIQSLYYLWTGHMPTEQQEQMLNACLVAVIDHGQEALSSKTARMAASGGAEMHAALAAGSLAAGKYHGTLPIRDAGFIFRSSVEENRSAADLVHDYLQIGERLPGYGHRIYETDPRTQALLRKAEEFGMKDAHVNFALEVEAELEKQKGKKLCLNVDGMIASLLPGLGIDPELGQSLFLIGRQPGMAYHVFSQKKEKPASMREKSS